MPRASLNGDFGSALNPLLLLLQQLLLPVLLPHLKALHMKIFLSANHVTAVSRQLVPCCKFFSSQHTQGFTKSMLLLTPETPSLKSADPVT